MRSTLEGAVNGGLLFCMAWERRGTLRQVLRDHPLVVVRASGIRPEDLLEVARGLGVVVPSNLKRHAMPGHPELMILGDARDADGNTIGGSAVVRGWHSDMSYTAEPPQVTLLYGATIPGRGGDTHYASLYALHDRLDAATRERWASLRVEHVYRSPRPGEPVRLAVHPLVRVHPESGRPLVYASPGYASRILDVPEAESEEILRRLAGAFEPPDYVHRWQAGDLVVWDNRALVHRATPYDPDELRVCWRAAVRLAG